MVQFVGGFDYYGDDGVRAPLVCVCVYLVSNGERERVDLQVSSALARPNQVGFLLVVVAVVHPKPALKLRLLPTAASLDTVGRAR